MIDISVPIRSSRWIRNRDGERSVGIRLLHGKVAAPSSDLDETVGGQDAAGFTAGQDAKPNQPQPRSSLRRLRLAGADQPRRAVRSRSTGQGLRRDCRGPRPRSRPGSQRPNRGRAPHSHRSGPTRRPTVGTRGCRHLTVRYIAEPGSGRVATMLLGTGDRIGRCFERLPRPSSVARSYQQSPADLRTH